MRRSLLAVAVLTGLAGLYPHVAHAQTCTSAVIPDPANRDAVYCFSVGKPTAQRCASAIDSTICLNLNNGALHAGLLTQDGYDYLTSINFCAMTADYGEGNLIYDFCPRGCFAADTKIASTVGTNGIADYVAAQSVLPQSSLMAMTDDASLGEVILAPQSVKRTTHGPEDFALFAFALSNGHTLRVTMHHPMVLDSGKIIEASDVTAGMSFVGLDGQSVAVTAVTREKPIGEVFNFETTGDTELGHVIVAEGVLVGDLKIQDDLSSEDASIALRR